MFEQNQLGSVIGDRLAFGKAQNSPFRDATQRAQDITRARRSIQAN
jgi:hypothetical protein